MRLALQRYCSNAVLHFVLSYNALAQRRKFALLKVIALILQEPLLRP